MKRTTRILAIAATLVFLLAGCNIFFPPKDEKPATGPTFTGTITNAGASGITAVKVGVFENESPNLFNEDNDLGVITPLAALTPIKRGTISGSTHSTTFPVISTLSTESGSTWNLIAWHDANSDGLLDTDEYNTMATVNASAGSEGDPQDYFVSSLAYYDTPTAGTAGYRFKYFPVSGDGNSGNEVDPSTLTSTAGFDFEMNF